MPSRDDRGWRTTAVLCTALLWADTSAAADRLLVLEVVINGRHAGRVSEFTQRDGRLFFFAADLEELGLIVPADLAASAAPIPFTALSNVRATIDEAKQTLNIAATDSALRPTRIGARAPGRLTPLTKAQFGALLNYDSAMTYSDNRASGGALLDLRLFGPYGVVDSSALISVAPSGGQVSAARLNTTITVTQAAKLRRWRAGDVVSGALAWTRAVRLGGVQVASDFGLRPDLITFPLPSISASAAVPSTVDVMVNGIRQLSEDVQPGPFAISSLPVVTGAGQVSVSLLDALGQPTLITLPFYASSALLRPGLVSYSLEAGVVREDFGLRDDRYSGWALNQSSRFGVSNRLTLESHVEAAKGLMQVGGGAAFLLGTFGIANVAVAGSTGSQGKGGLVSAGFQRVSRRLNFGINGTYASTGYRDIAAIHDAPVPKATLDANAGYQFGRWGSIGLSYNRRIIRPSLTPHGGDSADSTDRHVELLTGSYGVSIGGANLHATGYKDLRDSHAFGLGAGLSLPMGRSGHASVETTLDQSGFSHSVNAVKTAQRAGEFGYRTRVTQGIREQRLAEGEYLASWGRVTGAAELSDGRFAARAGARGAVVLAGGDLYASDRIDDSFAVVSTGDVGGVPVMVENRLVGRSNRRGKLLIPSLRSFQDNRLSIDSTLLPADVEVPLTTMTVRPPDRSGVLVDFGVHQVRAALVSLVDRLGHALPLGSVAKVAGAPDQPVGHDGAAYLTGLRPRNRVVVDLPDGSRCAVHLNYQPVSGDIPRIGPLACV